MQVHDDALYFHNTRPEIVDLIPPGSKKILDVGCNDGSFGKIIKDKLNAEVWGVELNRSAGEIAKKVLDKVVIGDVDVILQELPSDYFDCICFNDVIEHIVNPWDLLSAIKKNY